MATQSTSTEFASVAYPFHARLSHNPNGRKRGACERMASAVVTAKRAALYGSTRPLLIA
jgi:hypothetical protein